MESSSTSQLVRARQLDRRIVRRLVEEPYAFDFFQAVYLIDRLFPEAPGPGQTSDTTAEAVHLRPSEALAFPAADVKDVEAVPPGAPGPAYVLTATFMGLYGVDASMPSHYHDVIATRPRTSRALRAFLDVFNHRLYTFYYRAWAKYRPALYAPPESPSTESDRHARRFLSLAGLGTIPDLDAAPVDPMRLASFAGRLGLRTRNAEGLTALLEGLLGGIDVEVEENVPRWIPMENRPSLGSGEAALGVNTNIGERVYDRSTRFRIHLGPLDLDDYLALLPGGDLAARVDWLVRLYTPDALDYDVKLTLEADDVDDTTLGSGTARLGLSSFLGRPSPSMARVVTYDADADATPTVGRTAQRETQREGLSTGAPASDEREAPPEAPTTPHPLAATPS